MTAAPDGLLADGRRSVAVGEAPIELAIRPAVVSEDDGGDDRQSDGEDRFGHRR